MKFKIDSIAADSSMAIMKKIQEKFPDTALKFEVNNSDRVLHIHGIPESSEHASRIESAIREAGFEGAWLERGFENK